MLHLQAHKMMLEPYNPNTIEENHVETSCKFTVSSVLARNFSQTVPIPQAKASFRETIVSDILANHIATLMTINMRRTDTVKKH